MKGSRFASIYAITVGALMIIMWAVFITLGQVPEYQTRPAEITLHIIDEFLTALLLLISGILVIRQIKWGNLILLTALGMLFYTMIVSPGYYIQRGETTLITMFAVLLAVGVVALIMQVKKILSLLE